MSSKKVPDTGLLVLGMTRDFKFPFETLRDTGVEGRGKEYGGSLLTLSEELTIKINKGKERKNFLK